MQLRRAPLLYCVVSYLLCRTSSANPEIWEEDSSLIVDATLANLRSAKNTTHCTEWKDCDSCNSARWCHWCGESKGCHVQGSAYGCARGETCHIAPPNNDTCLAHETCADCSLHSSLCHWCAHDNACHLIGSFYGCLRGVDCYDISHCKRSVPEKLPDESISFRIIPIILALVLSCVVMCCATLCCCAVSFTKDAYDDLVADVTTPLLFDPQEQLVETTAEETNDNDIAIVDNEEPEEGNDQEQPNEALNEEDVEPQMEADDMEQQPQQEQSVATRSIPANTPTRRRPGRTIHRLYNACVIGYVVSMIGVSFVSYGILKFFPEAPENSICNDAIAWKSIVDAMAHRSVAANFQLLASIQNPNYLDVAVDMGKGSFYHKNDYIGSFEIPPVTIQARSITDLLITAQFAPEKWQSLSIGAEYYAGTLVLTVDSQVTIRMPNLFNYKFTASVEGLAVNVNQAADRHLCACPTWSDAKTKVPAWLEEPYEVSG